MINTPAIAREHRAPMQIKWTGSPTSPDNELTNTYGSGLFALHVQLLRDSAVPPEVARRRGYVSVDSKTRLEQLGYSPAQRRVPGLLVPLHDIDGNSAGCQYRPDDPRQRNGRPVKYETPRGQANRLDVPVGIGGQLGDPTVDLWVTESARKADAAVAVGVVCVSLPGVWNWLTTNGQGGKVALPDWRDVALNGRRVVLAFDSDSATNPNVAKARDELARYLTGKGARVAFCQLPHTGEGKTGLDDYLAAGHSRAEVEELVVDRAVPPVRPEMQSAAVTVVQRALQCYRLGLSSDNDPFVVPVAGPQLVQHLTGKGPLRAALADDYYTLTGRVAPQQALAEALLTLEGRARQQDPERLHLRVAEHTGVHYLDLGDRSGRAVAFDSTGWRIVERPPLLFRRTKLSGSLPEPVGGGDINELWGLLNVTSTDRPLVLAFLISALIPDLAHPILVLRGEQGSGKSTATRTLTALLDSSPVQVRKPPRDGEGWVTAAAGSWMVGVDNVSSVPEWFSDALCRAVTGDGDVRRQLYSDADLVVFNFRRVVVLNGIDLGALRDDLSERLLVVELQRIQQHGRRLDAELDSQWDDAHPRLLGALLDLAAQVLEVLPQLEASRLPRMADFARLLAAVDQVLGTNGTRTYAAQAGELAADVIDSEPILASITAIIRHPWQGTSKELLELITPQEPGWRPPRTWPKDARDFTALLRQRSPALRGVGWTVDDLGRGGRNKLTRFHLIPPTTHNPPATVGIHAGDPRRQRATNSAAPAKTGFRRMDVTLPPQPAGRIVVDDTGDAGDAGDAGDTGDASRLWDREETREPCSDPTGDGPTGTGPELTPATPSSPAEIGPCAGCQRPITRYGPNATGALCKPCRDQLVPTPRPTIRVRALTVNRYAPSAT